MSKRGLVVEDEGREKEVAESGLAADLEILYRTSVSPSLLHIFTSSCTLGDAVLGHAMAVSISTAPSNSP